MPKVNPEILRWARETAGLSLEEATLKLQLSSARGVPGIDRLNALETGADTPTRPLLLKMAKQYRRPLLIFYMSAPPRHGDRGQDFRTLPDGDAVGVDALLDAMIRDIQARQSLVRAVLEDEDEAAPLPFIGSKTISDGVVSVVASIRDTLQTTIDDYRAESSSQKAFELIRKRTEKAGIFVLLKCDLGSHHSVVDLQTFRGFALADPVAPFVVINDQDSKAALAFTLLHELAHLWLGQTGVSGWQADLSVERFCNDVASEFLLPEQETMELAIASDASTDEIVRIIGEYATPRNLSNTMVAYRLYRLGFIGGETWSQLRSCFRELWIRGREKRREKSRDQDGGPDFYTVRAYRTGVGLLELVRRMLGAGALTTTKAGKVLGVKAKQVERLLAVVGRSDIRRTA